MVAPSNLLLIVLFTACPIVVVFGSPCVNSTNNDTYEFVDGNCVYFKVDQPRIKHREAAEACAKRSSHEFEWRLPKVDTDEKNEKLRQILRKEPTIERGNVRTVRFWIGLLRDDGGGALHGDEVDTGFDPSNSTSTKETIDYDRWRWIADNESLEWSANLTRRWAGGSAAKLRQPTPQCVAAYIEAGTTTWDILECEGADGTGTDSLVCEMVRQPPMTTTTTSPTTITTSTTTTTTTTPTTTSPTPTTSIESISTAAPTSSMETDPSSTEIETDSTTIETERPTTDGVRITSPTSASTNVNSPSSGPPVSKVSNTGGNGPFGSSSIRDETVTKTNKSANKTSNDPDIRSKDDTTGKGESSGISWIGLAIGLFFVAVVVVVAVGISLYVVLIRRPRRRRARRGKGGAAVISIRGSSVKAFDSERSEESSRYRRRRNDDESERM